MPTLTDTSSAAAAGAQQISAGLELATEQYHNWKQILSGALNDRQLVCGLGILFIFYVLYSIFNTVTGDKEEDNATCQCPLFHKRYYQAIVFGSVFIWVICFASIIIYDIYRLYDDNKRTVNGNRSKSITKNNRTAESTDDSQCNKTSNGPNDSSIFSALDDKLKHCENCLWLEFYKAYSAGSGTYEKINIPDIESIITRETEDATRDEPDFGMEDVEKYAKRSFFFFYPVLVIVRLLAQISLVPILILQMLNTYAWICLTEGYHCQNAVTQYQLGLYQAYMTFGFYIALLIAMLATTMLRWFPRSKHARNIGTASCA